MTSCLSELLSFFPVGTAEGEREILTRAYVKNDSFGDLLAPPRGSPRLLIGKKGTGKTAIIQYASEMFTASGIPFLSLKPLDLDLGSFEGTVAVATLTREAYKALVTSIASQLGSQMTGLLGQDSILLYEEAIKEGKKKRDLVGSIAKLLPSLAKPVIQADLSAIFRDTAATATELRNSIASALGKSGTAFYVFLDDTDQVAAPSIPDQLNRIWAFLLAAREVTQRIPAVRIVITIREEVWRRLVRDKAGQRDQADHFIPLIRELSPSLDHIRAVIERRLSLAAEACGIPSTFSPYAIFFEGTHARMPHTEETRNWEDLIVLRSRERPRDAVQLIQALARRAQARNAQKISEGDFHAEMPEFSAQRVFLLAQEVETECPEIREVVDSLADVSYDYGSFKITAETLRGHLQSVPSRFSTTLFGKTLKPNNDEDAFNLWKFLFELGIINARVADTSKKDGYRHITPSDEPGLVSRARWNDLQGMIWEINPAYRDFLVLKQEQESRRSGLPKKKFR